RERLVDERQREPEVVTADECDERERRDAPGRETRRRPRDPTRGERLRVVRERGERSRDETEHETRDRDLREQHAVDRWIELRADRVVDAEPAHDEVTDDRRGERRDERLVADPPDGLHLEREDR